MGYRGKLLEQQRARELRAQAWTLSEIADELGVAKGSVSLWVRDVQFSAEARNARALERKVAGTRAARLRGPNRLQREKEAQIEQLAEEGRRRIGSLSEREFLVAGAALYAGEGAKGEGKVQFANTNPLMIDFFCRWLRCFFAVDESRLRMRIHLHEGCDLEVATAFWSELTDIPIAQFGRPHRVPADRTLRLSKHVMGCPSVSYSCTRTHRAIMGMVRALLSSAPLPG